MRRPVLLEVRPLQRYVLPRIGSLLQLQDSVQEWERLGWSRTKVNKETNTDFLLTGALHNLETGSRDFRKGSLKSGNLMKWRGYATKIHRRSLRYFFFGLGSSMTGCRAIRMTTHGAHKRVQHGHCKGCSTSKRLSQIQFKIIVIFIIDVQVLHILIKS